MLSTVIDLCRISRIREDLHRDDLSIHADVAMLQRQVEVVNGVVNSNAAQFSASLASQATSLASQVRDLEDLQGLASGYGDIAAELSRVRDNQSHILEQISRLSSENDALRRSVTGIDAEAFRNLAASLPHALREMRRREVEWQRNLDESQSKLAEQIAAIKNAVNDLQDRSRRVDIESLGESIRTLSAAVSVLEGKSDALSSRTELTSQQTIQSQVLAESFRAIADDVRRMQRELPVGLERLGQRLGELESAAISQPGPANSREATETSFAGPFNERGKPYQRLRRPGAEYEESATPIIVNPQKVSLQNDEGFRLYLNFGDRAPQNYINVSSREIAGADVVSPFSRLPFGENTVLELASANILQQFSEDEIQNVIFPHWFRLLRGGGVLKLTVPDAENTIREYTSGQLGFDQLRHSILGPESAHRSMLSPGLLRRLLAGAGFVNPVFTATGRRAGHFLELEVHATKPAQGGAAA